MKNLDDKLDYWQEKLRLQQWDVTAEMANHYDVTDDCNAYIEFDEFHLKAKIRVVKEKHLKPGATITDPEVLLVHELLHLVIPLSITEMHPDNLAWERGLNVIARLLVEMDRGEEDG